MVNWVIGRSSITICLAVITFIQEIYGQEKCPWGWTSDERRGRCVKVMDLQLNNSNAINSCRSCGGDLIRIEDLQDQEIATSIIQKHIAEGRNKNRGYFIDMNDEETTNVWKFENGDNVTWFYWDSDQPNGYKPKYPNGQHCMMITASTLKWHDQECTNQYHYVCMRRIDYGGLTENTFMKVNSCLEKKAVFQHFSSPIAEDCAVACSSDPCCTDIAHDSTECILYAFDPDQTKPVCLGSSFMVFSKIIA